MVILFKVLRAIAAMIKDFFFLFVKRRMNVILKSCCTTALWYFIL